MDLEICSKNDVILTARPRGRGALGGLHAKHVSVGCDGVRVCGGELRSRYHVYKNLWDASVGEELPCEW